MGSVTPRAKAPPQVVYYTPPATPAAPSEPDISEEEKQATVQEEREKNLLRRARSTIGTVLNGFKGILTPSDDAPPRKSLLGE